MDVRKATIAADGTRTLAYRLIDRSSGQTLLDGEKSWPDDSSMVDDVLHPNEMVDSATGHILSAVAFPNSVFSANEFIAMTGNKYRLRIVVTLVAS